MELVLVYELRKSLDTCLIVDMSAYQAGTSLAGSWVDLLVSLKVTPSSFKNTYFF